MPYRVRAFCTKDNVPTLRQVFDHARSRGIRLAADEAHGPIDPDTTEWTDAEITYKSGKSPLVIECHRDDGSADCLAKVEPREYIDEIRVPGFSIAKRRVIRHLKNTRTRPSSSPPNCSMISMRMAFTPTRPSSAISSNTAAAWFTLTWKVFTRAARWC